MTKNELIEQVQICDDSITKEQAKKAVETVFGAMKENLINGDPVFYRGFGTFKIVVRKPKTARNISKGTTILIPARKKPVFKPSKEFVNLVNGQSH